MKTFNEYFTRERIIRQLCNIRVKIAKGRNRKHRLHIITKSKSYNYHLKTLAGFNYFEEEKLNNYEKYNQELVAELNRILPGRRQWIRPFEYIRNGLNEGNMLSTIQINLYSLQKTIEFRERSGSNLPWVVNLERFIQEIQEAVKQRSFKIEPPITYPNRGNKEDNKCRPISVFGLRERIILSITNSYLTDLFDDYLEPCSYAFRKKRDDSKTVSHHDCIKAILNYKKQHDGKPLWVVECDIKKFYDSVNHKIIKALYTELISKSQEAHPGLDFTTVSHIFHSYLDSYSFSSDIFSKLDDDYWENHRIPSGRFEWIDGDLEENGYYCDFRNERIGVPQGGALSGLIANIVLDVADKIVLQTGVFYLRFCDDMVIMHPEKSTCELARDLYLETLRSLKLVWHDFKSPDQMKEVKAGRVSHKPFWESKSKGPFIWDSIENGGFPWIGFVGYEINNEGSVRVRKKSLNKEIEKQKKIKKDFSRASFKELRRSKEYIGNSLINTLVGMSVGRVNMRNYQNCNSSMCWKNGFKALNYNKYSVRQMRLLDRFRNKYYESFLKKLSKRPDPEKVEKPSKSKVNRRNREIVDYNKPFSYYYQVLERKEDSEKLNNS